MDGETPDPETCRRLASQIAADLCMHPDYISSDDDVGLSVGRDAARTDIWFFLERFHVQLGGSYERQFFYQELWDARLALLEIMEAVRKFSDGEYLLSVRSRGLLKRKVVRTCVVNIDGSDESPLIFDQI